jgi:hypothetical protein
LFSIIFEDGRFLFLQSQKEDEIDDRAASFEYSKPATMVFFIMERYQENGALPGT